MLDLLIIYDVKSVHGSESICDEESVMNDE